MRGGSSVLAATLAAATWGTIGCAAPRDEDACGSGPVELILDPDRPGFAELVDGGLVPVFIPPQTGVFTEIDVLIHGVAVEDVVTLRVTIDPHDGNVVADQSYLAASLPLFCLPGGDILMRRMPIAFEDGTVLDELDGVEAELTLEVLTTQTAHRRMWNVELRVTEF